MSFSQEFSSAEDRTGTKLVTITGGLQNNAICREAEAAVTIAKDKAELQDLVQEWQKILKKEFKISDPDVKVVLDEAEKRRPALLRRFRKDHRLCDEPRQRCDRDEHGSSGVRTKRKRTIVTDNDTVTVRVCYRSGLNSKKEYTIEKSRRLENGTCRICGRIQFFRVGINQTAA
ncbi:MAG: peptidase dimerization domain-containing protein [Clostridium sp.]